MLNNLLNISKNTEWLNELGSWIT